MQKKGVENGLKRVLLAKKVRCEYNVNTFTVY